MRSKKRNRKVLIYSHGGGGEVCFRLFLKKKKFQRRRKNPSVPIPLPHHLCAEKHLHGAPFTPPGKTLLTYRRNATEKKIMPIAESPPHPLPFPSWPWINNPVPSYFWQLASPSPAQAGGPMGGFWRYLDGITGGGGKFGIGYIIIYDTCIKKNTRVEKKFLNHFIPGLYETFGFCFPLNGTERNGTGCCCWWCWKRRGKKFKPTAAISEYVDSPPSFAFSNSKSFFFLSFQSNHPIPLANRRLSRDSSSEPEPALTTLLLLLCSPVPDRSPDPDSVDHPTANPPFAILRPAGVFDVVPGDIKKDWFHRHGLDAWRVCDQVQEIDAAAAEGRVLIQPLDERGGFGGFGNRSGCHGEGFKLGEGTVVGDETSE